MCNVHVYYMLSCLITELYISCLNFCYSWMIHTRRRYTVTTRIRQRLKQPRRRQGCGTQSGLRLELVQLGVRVTVRPSCCMSCDGNEARRSAYKTINAWGYRPSRWVHDDRRVDARAVSDPRLSSDRRSWYGCWCFRRRNNCDILLVLPGLYNFKQFFYHPSC